MKIYCGTDIIEIARIKEAIDEYNNVFLEKIYSENEIKYCESKGNMKYQHYAARFAAKEAIYKAVSELLDDKFELSWKKVEIINNKSGKPMVKFYSLPENLENKIQDIDISLSHIKENAIAMVVVTANK